jgi:hypothetical protein
LSEPTTLGILQPRARTAAPERECLPRATEISDRIEAALDAMAAADMDVVPSTARAELEGYRLALAYTFAWGRDLDEEEYSQWLARLEPKT